MPSELDIIHMPCRRILGTTEFQAQWNVPNVLSLNGTVLHVLYDC